MKLAILTDATVTASSNQVVNCAGDAVVTLFINVTASPTGTTPTLLFSIEEIDPSDRTTVLSQSVGTSINAAGTQRVTLGFSGSPVVQVSWAIGGGSPSFTGVNAYLVTNDASMTGTWFGSDAPTVGQKVMASSLPVVLASDHSVITVAANQGTAAALSGAWPVKVTDGTNTMPTGDAIVRALFEKITDGTNTAVVKAASTAPAAADAALVVTVSPNCIVPTPSSTGTLSNVSASITSVTLLASNTSRRGAIVHNDSAKALYVKLGSSASLTSYTELLLADDTWEVPYGYTGIITGIWTAASGTARVTELT